MYVLPFQTESGKKARLAFANCSNAILSFVYLLTKKQTARGLNELNGLALSMVTNEPTLCLVTAFPM
jgi:hypothetical protein